MRLSSFFLIKITSSNLPVSFELDPDVIEGFKNKVSFVNRNIGTCELPSFKKIR